MPKVAPAAPTVVTPHTTRASQPSATPQPAATAPSSWGNGPSVSSTERREKATGVTTKKAELNEAERTEVVQKKATCPFIATGVSTGALPVRNNAEKPLASIDDVVKLGNTGKGSDLGDLLKIFAEGNHAFMPGMSGKMDLPVPQGTLSLDFPGSQGSHAGPRSGRSTSASPSCSAKTTSLDLRASTA